MAKPKKPTMGMAEVLRLLRRCQVTLCDIRDNAGIAIKFADLEKLCADLDAELGPISHLTGDGS